MDRILIWNIRGLNNPNKQKEIKKMIQELKVGLCCLLETKVRNEKFGEVYNNMLKDWCIASNFTYCKEGRISIAWLSDFFQVHILYTHPQHFHIQVKNIALNFLFHCTFVYGFIDHKEREDLRKGD